MIKEFVIGESNSDYRAIANIYPMSSGVPWFFLKIVSYMLSLSARILTWLKISLLEIMWNTQTIEKCAVWTINRQIINRRSWFTYFVESYPLYEWFITFWSTVEILLSWLISIDKCEACNLFRQLTLRCNMFSSNGFCQKGVTQLSKIDKFKENYVCISWNYVFYEALKLRQLNRSTVFHGQRIPKGDNNKY